MGGTLQFGSDGTKRSDANLPQASLPGVVMTKWFLDRFIFDRIRQQYGFSTAVRAFVYLLLNELAHAGLLLQ